MNLHATLMHFKQRFPTEVSCFSYIFKLKWPKGYRCPRCQSSSAYVIATRNLPLYECRFCHHQTTLTANTIMEKSRTSLRKWLLAIFLVAQPTNINTVSLSEQLGVSYKTAWTMLHKIRKAIHHFDSEHLLEGTGRGAVECYGKPHNPTILRHSQEHPVLVLAAHKSNHMSYYKFIVIPAEFLNQKSLTPNGEETLKSANIAASTKSSFIIDKRYRLADSRYIRSLFKKACTSINQTFHGVGPKYLQFYLDEYCFRLNYSHYNDLITLLTSICLTPLSTPLLQMKEDNHLYPVA